MQDFYYSIPTKIYFGKDAVNHLTDCVKECGSKALLVYGKGSIKKNGLYDRITGMLSDAEIAYEELSGVDANPRITTVRDGVEICKTQGIDVVIPIGGGSTIDCAKAVAAGACYDGDAWELIEDNSRVKKALPIIAVPTMAATGSEMDYFSVITNQEKKLKKEIANENLYPMYALLDPQLTFSVSPYQTACGTVDMFSHIMEVYFAPIPRTEIQDRIMEGLMKTMVQEGPKALKNPSDYDARANLLWASEWAINGFICSGKLGPWPAHAIEHQLSAWYDVTHGHGLAVVIPELLRHILNEKSAPTIATYGVNVFGITMGNDIVETAERAIDKTEEFFKSLGLGLKLKDLGITSEEHFDKMAEVALTDGLDGCLVNLTKEDIIDIYKSCE